MTILRPPATVWDLTALPIPENSRQVKYINLRHPGLSPPTNILFRLPAVDIPTTLKFRCGKNAHLSLAEDLEIYLKNAGVHKHTMLLACFIVTGNRHGRIGTKARLDSTVVVDILSNDTILTENDYYYFPDGYKPGDPPYTWLSEFRRWTFVAPDTIQNHPLFGPWKVLYTSQGPSSFTTDVASSRVSTQVKARDQCCRLIGARDPLESAHIVPREEASWWEANAMYWYCSVTPPRPGTSDPTLVMENLIALRSDIHLTFDKGLMCFAPKENKLVAHFFKTSHVDSLRALQNRPLASPENICTEYWIARFAWTIFQIVTLPSPAVKSLREALNVPVDDSFGRTTAQLKEAGRAPDTTEAAAVASSTQGGHPVNLSETRQMQVYKESSEAPALSLSSRDDLSAGLENVQDDVEFPPGLFDDVQATNPTLERFRESLPIYPGFRKVEKLKTNYMLQHPVVTAVVDPEHVWENEESE